MRKYIESFKKNNLIKLIFFLLLPIIGHSQYYRQAIITKVINNHELICKEIKNGNIRQLTVKNCISPTGQPTTDLTHELKGTIILLHWYEPTVITTDNVKGQIMLDSLDDNNHLIEIIYCPNP